VAFCLQCAPHSSPYTIAVYLGWYASWIYRIRICGQKCTHDDLVYLICKNMGFSLQRFEVGVALRHVLLFETLRMSPIRDWFQVAQ
jgi:hypothetical protein